MSNSLGKVVPARGNGIVKLTGLCPQNKIFNVRRTSWIASSINYLCFVLLSLLVFGYSIGEAFVPTNLFCVIFWHLNLFLKAF